MQFQSRLYESIRVQPPLIYFCFLLIIYGLTTVSLACSFADTSQKGEDFQHLPSAQVRIKPGAVTSSG